MTQAEQIATLIADVERLKTDYQKIETRLTALERFQSWIIGAMAVGGFLAGLFSDVIKKRLGFS